MASAPKTCKEMLAEARAALHDNALQKKVAQVSYGDRSIQYANYVTEGERLQLYIRALEQDPECGEFSRRRRPFTMSDA